MSSTLTSAILFYGVLEIAQTAHRNHIPFVILRAISDKADNSAEMDYPTFEKMSTHRCAEVTRLLAIHLKESQEG